MGNATPSLASFHTECGKLMLTSGKEEYRAIFPPKVEDVRILGTLSDQDKTNHPGTSGYSSTFGGSPYHIFERIARTGDGNAELTTSFNAAARVPDPEENPTHSTYVSIEPNGQINPFLELTESEKELERKGNTKVILSVQGGLCEGVDGSGKGHVWFRKTLRQKDEFTTWDIYQGTGVAAVSVDRTTGKLVAERAEEGSLLFRQAQPAFGTFCATSHDGWYYLWGKMFADIYLAKVPVNRALEREHYRYWDGYRFTADVRIATPLMTGYDQEYDQGMIFPSRLFGHNYQWVFLGNSGKEGCQVMMGAASAPQGPFKMTQITHNSDGRKLLPVEAGTDCIYYHPWAFNERVGQVLLTWSEKDQGGITGARVQFQMLHQGAFWKDISFQDVDGSMSKLIKIRPELVDITDSRGVYYEIDASTWFMKVSVRLVGKTAEIVDEAALEICKQVAVWARQAKGITDEQTRARAAEETKSPMKKARKFPWSRKKDSK
ncbi:hypothetical protein FQN55_001779 [Onygenales sp. PD_40]|nr:hypothetical protein FQN55_001779 [Onygenales sp. PD_40]KAK2787742.1 hypothetical protein FQN51_003081 [Onygenales sp. PD_10]